MDPGMLRPASNAHALGDSRFLQPHVSVTISRDLRLLDYSRGNSLTRKVVFGIGRAQLRRAIGAPSVEMNKCLIYW